MKNFGEKGAWVYPGTAQIFWVPTIISGMGKGTNLNFVRTFLVSIETKTHYKLPNKYLSAAVWFVSFH